MQSYNHPAWQHPRPLHHTTSFDVPTSTRARHASESGPSPYMSETSINASTSLIPPSLTPGRQHTRIWDKTATQQWPHTTIPSAYQPPRRPSLYGDYLLSHPYSTFSAPPPLPQKPQALVQPLTSSSPPVPPKPPPLTIAPASRIPLYPTSIPLPLTSLATFSPSHSEPEITPDEKEIERALTLSASEAQKREALIAQEEEELARALEESRLLSDSAYSLDLQPLSPLTSPADRASTPPRRASAQPPVGESWLHILTPTPSISSQHSPINEDLPALHPFVDQTEVSGDCDAPRTALNSVQNLHSPRDSLPPTPPLYATVVSNLVRSPLPTPPLNRSNVTPSMSAASSATYFANDHTASSDPSSPSMSLTHSNGGEHSPMPSFSSRPSWSSISSESSASACRSLGSEFYSTSAGYRSPSHPPASPDLSLGSSSNLEPLDEGIEEDGDTESEPSTRPTIPLSANQYVEPEMLVGVSLGFSIPVISTELQPMAGLMPHVITLPYGKAPLFHIQAQSWRKLLKLMARLSGTRVEPTVEALSIAKHDLKLRTVIQFVKIHHSASEWRTVLYLTTDYPLPAKLQNSHKYTNGDVSVLPYSYTLSPLPTLLRDGSESPMAKYYVVPATPTTPYPDLPINFPNLAMYLQSAVQDSRRAANDGSAGMRKLAQYIDSCYPREADRVGPIDEVASKKGVGGMFKRVMGRSKANRHSRGNDEIYDLVTPFVSDEWG